MAEHNIQPGLTFSYWGLTLIVLSSYERNGQTFYTCIDKYNTNRPNSFTVNLLPESITK